MKFRVIEITSASKVKVKSPQAAVIVPTNELIKLSDNEIGFLEGRFTDHQRGIYMQGGIIDPGWEGHLTAELLIFGECSIEVGQHIAHAIILSADEPDAALFSSPKLLESLKIMKEIMDKAKAKLAVEAKKA